MITPEANEVYESVEEIRREVFMVMQMLDAGDPVEAHKFAIRALSQTNITLGMFVTDEQASQDA